jgi:hypothetical protein
MAVSIPREPKQSKLLRLRGNCAHPTAIIEWHVGKAFVKWRTFTREKRKISL